MNPRALAEAVDSAILAVRIVAGPGVELHSAFAGTLRWSGVPEVYTPPYFWAPRSRRGTEEALEKAQSDAARWADERLVWRQPWYRADLISDPENDKRMTAWRRREELWKPVRPSRHICLRLFAAYSHDIAGLSTRWAIGYAVGLKGTDHRYDHSDPLPRFKTAPKIVALGRQSAHALGAWPWAQYPGGDLPDSWWRDDSALDALRDAAKPSALEPGRCPYPPGSRNVSVPLLPL